MIALKFCVWSDKKDEKDVRFLVKEVEAFVKEHCKNHRQTYVMDAEVRTFILPEEIVAEIKNVVGDTQEH